MLRIRIRHNYDEIQLKLSRTLFNKKKKIFVNQCYYSRELMVVNINCTHPRTVPFQKLIRIHVHAIKSSGNLHVEKAAGRRSFINR